MSVYYISVSRATVYLCICVVEKSTLVDLNVRLARTPLPAPLASHACSLRGRVLVGMNPRPLLTVPPRDRPRSLRFLRHPGPA